MTVTKILKVKTPKTFFTNWISKTTPSKHLFVPLLRTSEENTRYSHCVKSVTFGSYSGPHFPAFSPYSVQMRENADLNNSKYGHFSTSEWKAYPWKACWTLITCSSKVINCEHVAQTKYNDNPVSIYPLKVSNRNTRARCEICSKLTIKTPERRHWCRSAVFIVNFEHNKHIFLVFQLLTLNI